MIYVIVKDGKEIVGKEVYSGDDDINRADIEAVRTKYPTLTYEETTEDDFNIKVLSPSEEQSDWAVAKAGGTNQAISFLAKKLGLE